MHPAHSIYSDFWEEKLFSQIKFELKSVIGRIINYKRRKFLIKSFDNQYLNLGCGNNIQKSMVNADFFRFDHFKIGEKKNIPYPDWMLDLRYPLRCPNNVWKGIFCEHALEHLYPRVTVNLLKELYRTMKQNAYIRIVVPDLKKYVDFYIGKQPDRTFSQNWSTGCEAIRHLTQGASHKSLWDAELLGRVLKETGFREVRKVDYQAGSDCNIILDSPKRKWASLYMEAKK